MQQQSEATAITIFDGYDISSPDGDTTRRFYVEVEFDDARSFIFHEGTDYGRAILEAECLARDYRLPGADDLVGTHEPPNLTRE